MSGKGLIVVVSAPSGTGKTTVVKRLRERRPELVYSVSATTRAPRPNERNGMDYFFLSREEFLKRRDAGGFAECAEVHGQLYGTPESFLETEVSRGNDVLLAIDVQGAFQLKRKHPEAVLIFLVPPSLEELERRLRARRTDPDDVVKRRLEVAKTELGFKERYDDLVVNDELERAVRDLEAIIDREKARREGSPAARGGLR